MDARCRSRVRAEEERGEAKDGVEIEVSERPASLSADCIHPPSNLEC